MSCASCGCDLAAGAQFCVRCGRRTTGAQDWAQSGAQGWAPVAGAPAGYAAMPQPGCDRAARVEQHAQALGLAWCLFGAYRLVAVAAATSAARVFGWGGHFGHVFWPVLGFTTLFFSGLSVLAGFGLLTRRPWARGLAVFLGILSLFKVPVGTALGVYTLWVLGSRTGRQAWRQIEVV